MGGCGGMSPIGFRVYRVINPVRVRNPIRVINPVRVMSPTGFRVQRVKVLYRVLGFIGL